MKLKDTFHAVRKSWAVILIATIVGAGCGLAAALFTAPVYSAHARLFVSAHATGNTSDLRQGGSFTQNRMRSYVQLGKSHKVMSAVAEATETNRSAESLARSLSISTPINTVILDISAEGVTPQQAAILANTTAAELKTAIQDIETSSAGEESPVRVTIVKTAVPPTAPTSPKVALYLLAGLIFGGAIGIAAAIARQILDTRISGVDSVREVTDLPVLAQIPSASGGHDEVVMRDSPRSAQAEAYRELRTGLQFLTGASKAKSLVVTSSIQGEGKSTTVLNLAYALAKNGKRVCLIDADLRRPRLAEYLDMEGAAGLSTILSKQATLEEVTQIVEEGLDMVLSGETPPNPSELLGSTRMSLLLKDLRSKYDIVLIDAPPLLPVADGSILAGLTDGAIVVASCNVAHKQSLAEAIDRLHAVNAVPRGIVINRAPATSVPTYARYGEYHEDQEFKPMREAVGVSNTLSPLDEDLVTVEPIPKQLSARAIDRVEASRPPKRVSVNW